MKKIITIAMVAVFAAGLLAVSFAPLTASAADAAFDDGIVYTNPSDSDVYQVPGSDAGYYIDLATEKVYAPSGATVAGFYNGKKWVRITSIPAAGYDISKLLSKGGEFKLASALNEKGKEPTDDATVVTFPQISARPKTPKFIINYAIFASDTPDSNGQWTISEKGGDAVLAGLQVARTSDGKVPTAFTDSQDTYLWGEITDNVGMNLKGLSGNKQQKTKYLIRTAPVASGGSYVPASKIKKITVSGIGKAPKLKADYTLEVIKGKKGVNWAYELGLDSNNVMQYESGEFSDKDKIKAGVDLSKIMGQSVYLWTAATAKKPASAKQEYKTAERGLMRSGYCTVKSGKVTIPAKTHLVWNENTKKWGTALPSGLDSSTTELPIAVKATVKAGKESDTTFAMSEPGKLRLEWDNNKIVAAVIDPDHYADASEYPAGMLFADPLEIYHAFAPGEESYSATFTVKGLLDPADLTLDSKANPGKIFVEVLKNIKDNSISLEIEKDANGDFVSSSTAGYSTINVKVTGNITCDAEFMLKFTVPEALKSKAMDKFGVPTDNLYNAAFASSAVVHVVVPKEAQILKLKPIVFDPATDIRAFNTAYPSSGLQIASAKLNPGKITVNQSGNLTFVIPEGYLAKDGSEEFDSAVVYVGKYDTISTDAAKYTAKVNVTTTPAQDPSDPDIIDPVTVAVENNDAVLLAITKENDDGDKITQYYIYKVVDIGGPAFVSASFGNNQIEITLDERLLATYSTGGAFFVVELGDGTTVSANKVEVTNGQTDATIKLSFTNTISSPNSVTYCSGGKFQDPLSNYMQPQSISVNGSDISFANGIGSAPQNIAAPQATNFSGDYAVGYIYLNSGETGAITSNLDIKGYFTSNSKVSSAPSSETYAGESIAVANGRYLYLQDNSNNWYAFKVMRTSSVSITDRDPPSVKTAAGTKSAITIDFSESIFEYGYGLNPAQFEVKTGSITVTVKSVSVNGAKITLTFAADLDIKTTYSVTYKPASNGFGDASGNRVSGFAASVTIA